LASCAVELRRAGSAEIRRHVEQVLAHRVAAPFSPPPQLLLERLPTGISALDAQVAGLPRGSLTEICGPASSGRTTLLVAALAVATQRGEACCLIDATDAFDPHSAAAAGVELRRLLWVRCGGEQVIGPSGHRNIELLSDWAIELVKKPNANSATSSNSPTQSLNGSIASGRRHSFRTLERALKVTDLVLQGGGFGLVAIDLADVPNQAARRVPLTSWFRFRRAVEKTPTVLLAIEQEANAKTCASLVLKLSASSQQSAVTTSVPAHSRLLRGLNISVEVLRTPERKQPSSVRAQFATRRIG
jgi:recombination protein RecA